MLEPESKPPIGPGRRVGDWVVVGVLGKGGMATVYRLEHAETDAPAALKVLDLPSKQIRQRLIAEGELQRSLKHPNILEVLEITEIDHCPALVMEFIDGPDLATLLHKGGRLPEEQIEGIVVGILEGMTAAHERGIVHRDLKPQNILMAPTDHGWVPKIADFGLAKALEAAPGGHVTRTGQVMGTPQYMAPEQFRDAKNVDTRADVFALGTILYEVVTGRRAFDGEDLFEIYEKVGRSEYPPAATLAPEAPGRWLEAIERALRLDPARRPTTASALLALWEGARPRSEPDQRGPRKSVASLPASLEGPDSAGDLPSLVPTQLSTGLATSALIGATGLSMALGIGGLLSALLAVVLLMRPTDAEVAPVPVPVVEVPPAPVAAPVPLAPDPAPPPPEPVAPAPVAPEPAPVPAPPKPKPPPKPPPKVAPEPAPAPAVAQVRLAGDANVVVLRGSGATYNLTRGAKVSVPSGRYQGTAMFPSRGETPLGEVVVGRGELVYTCTSGFYTCRF